MGERFGRGSLLAPGVVIGALVFACSLFGLTVLLLMMVRPEPIPAAASTAVLTVIHASTATAPPPTPEPTVEVTPTSAVPPSPPPGVISIGAFVQISGTGGDGLRMRTEPGLQGTVRAVAIEAEVFQISDGPSESDGYTWWYLTAPYDQERQGWAVSNYLQVIQNP